MRTLLLIGATLVLLAGSMPAQAADIYAPVPGYSQAPPVYQPVPGFAEAPPPAYAPLDPPYAYPPPQRYRYGPPGYGPQPGYVYSGPPVEELPAYAEDPRLSRECWWEWGHRRCEARRGW